MIVFFVLVPSESIYHLTMIGIWNGDSLMEVCGFTRLRPKRFVLGSLSWQIIADEDSSSAYSSTYTRGNSLMHYLQTRVP